MSNLQLLTPYKMGPYTLKNRMVMAPMTRSRADQNNAPTELTALYYQQRASAGLIITEATQISPQGVGYVSTPGIHSEKQVKGWKLVTDAVHQKGGLIFPQLWHVGRISHSEFHNGQPPVAPSAIKANSQVFISKGLTDCETPRALEISEIPGIIEDYRKAAKNALKAGFDGVEVHSANGYLLNQFLCDGSNTRTDEYGGSIENRSRLTLEVVKAVVDELGSDKVGIRLSPSGLFNDVYDSNPKELFEYLVGKLNDMNLTYIHMMEPMVPLDPEKHKHYIKNVTDHFRPLIKTTMITNVGFTRETGNEAIEKNRADLIAYGAIFLANPDLPRRFELNAELNTPDQDTFYTPGEKGYTDYPFLD